jgi:sec-independent protein translocase protein TatA
MPGLGAPELIVILVIALVVLGPKRLPEAGRGLGRSLREFKDGLTGPDEEPHAAVAAPADHDRTGSALGASPRWPRSPSPAPR